ncbi:Uncharacterised protein [Streptococcus suis]|nr:Uncharacterised protein [Streptococcus suis]
MCRNDNTTISSTTTLDSQSKIITDKLTLPGTDNTVLTVHQDGVERFSFISSESMVIRNITCKGKTAKPGLSILNHL